MSPEELDQFVATITPDRVTRLAWQVEARQPKVNRGTAPLWEILEELTLDLALGTASERSPVDMRLRQAIIEAISQTDGMTFVEGDG